MVAAPDGPVEPAIAALGEVVTAVFPSDTRPRPWGVGAAADRARRARMDSADDPLTGVPPASPRALATLVWDDGLRHEVRRPTVFGRNPQPVPGWNTVAVRDETLSLSRTHLAVGGAVGAAWLADSASTNGTEIMREGERHVVAPGERWMLRAGDILVVGDRRVTVEGV